MVPEQQKVLDSLNRIVEIFKNSDGSIRPHFLLTGPSGSGKTKIISDLAEEHDIGFLDINAAQLTKEGTAGNSLSKALAPLKGNTAQLMICFVDEFDKLFISGNSNTQLAHETTNGVQNEFLKVLESKTTSVFADYGKYASANVETVLFVFAGAFNGEEDLTADKLRDFGIKTEFLGRVGLVYNLEKLSVKSLEIVLRGLALFKNYCRLFDVSEDQEKIEKIVRKIMDAVEAAHAKNTLGIRILHKLVNQYFITGELTQEEIEKTVFQKKLTLGDPDFKINSRNS